MFIDDFNLNGEFEEVKFFERKNFLFQNLEDFQMNQGFNKNSVFEFCSFYIKSFLLFVNVIFD